MLTEAEATRRWGENGSRAYLASYRAAVEAKFDPAQAHRIAETTARVRTGRLTEYSPGQMRDQRGRWSKQLGVGGVSPDEFSPSSKMGAVMDWQGMYADCRAIQENPESRTARAFAAALNESPRTEGPVYRGFDEYRGKQRLSLDEARTKWEGKVGQRVEMNVPTSTSPDLPLAAGFGKVVFEIRGGDARDITAFSAVPQFRESILLPGSFKVEGVRAGPDIPNSDSPFRTDTSPTLIVSLVAEP